MQSQNLEDVLPETPYGDCARSALEGDVACVDFISTALGNWLSNRQQRYPHELRHAVAPTLIRAYSQCPLEVKSEQEFSSELGPLPLPTGPVLEVMLAANAHILIALSHLILSEISSSISESKPEASAYCETLCYYSRFGRALSVKMRRALGSCRRG
ncbi:hypothetical protein C7476_109144 [Phyllobacterium bourgognense]|uniref:Uncharacterized protein n=1 Tax=Phyllobacterium bourgognense TaxID=314236 RepID=A0A368YNZ7_9HYPH|nr:hypothetical protein C7476_109144 [Phyllobacterium bourgognense]